MSDPRAKAERSKAKDLRQQSAPSELKRCKDRKRKKDKPYCVEQMFIFLNTSLFTADWNNKWLKFNCYATQEEAEKVVDLQTRKYPDAHRIKFRLTPVDTD